MKKQHATSGVLCAANANTLAVVVLIAIVGFFCVCCYLLPFDPGDQGVSEASLWCCATVTANMLPSVKSLSALFLYRWYALEIGCRLLQLY